MLPDRPLPADTDLEATVIAGVLGCASPSAAKRFAAMLKPDVFTHPEHSKAWQALRDIAAAGTVDRTNWLQAARTIVSGPVLARIVSGSGMAPTALDVATATLCDMAHRRALMIAAASAWESAADGTPGAVVSQSLDTARRAAIAAYGGDSAVTLSEAGAKFDAFKANLQSDKSNCLMTGIDELDRHGPIPPEYCLIMARSSIGKTAMALSLALQQVYAGKRVLFWSGEQQVEMIVCKLVSLLTNLGSQEILGVAGTTTAEQQAIATARGIIDRLPIRLLDQRKSVEQIWGYAAQLKAQDGLDAVYLDQFDKVLTTGTTRQNREEKLADVSRNLFAMCLDLRVPTFLLVQLGLKAQKENPNPEPWQVRDCSQVVQDADRCYVLDRPAAEPERLATLEKAAAKAGARGNWEPQQELQRMKSSAIVRLAKNRNGVGGCWREFVPFDETCGRLGAVPKS